MHLPIVTQTDSLSNCRGWHRGESRLVVARNGVFVERRGPMYTTSTRLRPGRHAVGGPQPVLHARRAASCPPPMHRVMLSFFLQAHRIHGGEAALVLLFHPERRRYLWHCPVQTVDLHEHHDGWYVEDTIEFDNPLDLPEGYLQLGDAHLHPDWTPSECLDVRDDQDGLHIIVGNITRTPQYHIDFVMDGIRFPTGPRQFFADPATRPGSRAPSRGSTRSASAPWAAEADRDVERSELVVRW